MARPLGRRSRESAGASPDRSNRPSRDGYGFSGSSSNANGFEDLAWSGMQGASGAPASYGAPDARSGSSRTRRRSVSDRSSSRSSSARPSLRKGGRADSKRLGVQAAADPAQRAGSAAPTAGGAPHRRSSNPYSRDNAVDDYGRTRKKRKRRKILVGCLVAALALVLCTGGAAFAYLMKIQGNLQEGIDDELLSVLDPTYGGEPFYMLLMGVDGSFDRGAAEMNDNSGTRSDSMILARIDPDEKQVTMVSLHRDTMIDMGKNGVQKLNAAHSIGGPAYAVQVVEDFAGVNISHYAEINFDAFSAMVDELGGVTVDVPMEIDDDMAGGYVPAGVQTLNGEQALILCRARHAYDDYGDGDTYRAANQRMVLGAIMEKVLASDPVTMASTLEALSKYVVTDYKITDIIALATSMVGMDMGRDFYTGMTPTSSAYINDTWYEKINQSAWDAMMKRVDQGLPPNEEDVVHETGTVLATSGSGSSVSELVEEAASQRSGMVTVKNGTDTSGLGAKAVERITPLGYTAEASNANRSDYEDTVIVYEKSNQREAAQEIADALGCGRVVQNDDNYIYDGDFLVLIGSDWK